LVWNRGAERDRKDKGGGVVVIEWLSVWWCYDEEDAGHRLDWFEAIRDSVCILSLKKQVT
jgi:hypothetical protein